ncbi:9066_t:CDS:1, partial [Ambispora leptoticha]
FLFGLNFNVDGAEWMAPCPLFTYLGIHLYICREIEDLEYGVASKSRNGGQSVSIRYPDISNVEISGNFMFG